MAALPKDTVPEARGRVLLTTTTTKRLSRRGGGPARGLLSHSMAPKPQIPPRRSSQRRPPSPVECRRTTALHSRSSRFGWTPSLKKRSALAQRLRSARPGKGRQTQIRTCCNLPAASHGNGHSPRPLRTLQSSHYRSRFASLNGSRRLRRATTLAAAASWRRKQLPSNAARLEARGVNRRKCR
jgi:hypothetical protein